MKILHMQHRLIVNSNSMKTFPTYEEAQRIVQEKGINSASEYKLSYKELGLPAAPDESYKGKGWIDWYSFFGMSKV